MEMQRLVETFNFHNCDSLSLHTDKIDPRRRTGESKEQQVTSLMYATGAGSLSSIQRYLMAGVDLGQCNYDGRTPLHVATAEGHQDIVEFLVTKAKVPVNPSDRYDDNIKFLVVLQRYNFIMFFGCLIRWSRTPLDEAMTFCHGQIADFLRQNGAHNGTIN